LTEIPIPNETRHQRFINVAESEPFGPIDAAKLLGIESAAETLEKLNSPHVNEKDLHSSDRAAKNAVSFIAPELEGEKSLFKFTNAKVGEVGFRYGASRDDRRHGRKVRYTETGQMIYA
jgi:hypothetical protein